MISWLLYALLVKVPEKQCRIAFQFYHEPVAHGDWTTCKDAEANFNSIVNDDAMVGMAVWTEEQTKIKDKWGDVKYHTEVEYLPYAFVFNREV